MDLYVLLCATIFLRSRPTAPEHEDERLSLPELPQTLLRAARRIARNESDNWVIMKSRK